MERTSTHAVARGSPAQTSTLSCTHIEALNVHNKRRSKLRDVPAHHGRDVKPDLDDKHTRAAASRRPSRDARIPRSLRTHEFSPHPPGDHAAPVEVCWVERVLVRHPIRRGDNDFLCRRLVVAIELVENHHQTW